MKKFFVSILALIYITTSTGAVVNIHYCMGKLVNLELWHSDTDKCSKCGMKNNNIKKGCCKDEQKQIKLVQDQRLAISAMQSLKLGEAELPTSFLNIYAIAPLSTAAISHVNHIPPLLHNGVPIYIFNCIYRI